MSLCILSDYCQHGTCLNTTLIPTCVCENGYTGLRCDTSMYVLNILYTLSKQHHHLILLADLFLYSHEAEFIQGLVQKREKKLAQSFIFIFRYIVDVLSLNNNKFSDHLHLIYPSELEIKDAIDLDKSASYLDLFFSKLLLMVG